MFNEYKFFRRLDDLDALAAWEESLAARRGGHHAPMARMIRRAAAGAGPRQQLRLFPDSTVTVVAGGQ